MTHRRSPLGHGTPHEFPRWKRPPEALAWLGTLDFNGRLVDYWAAEDGGLRLVDAWIATGGPNEPTSRFLPRDGLEHEVSLGVRRPEDAEHYALMVTLLRWLDAYQESLS